MQTSFRIPFRCRYILLLSILLSVCAIQISRLIKVAKSAYSRRREPIREQSMQNPQA